MADNKNTGVGTPEVATRSKRMLYSFSSEDLRDMVEERGYDYDDPRFATIEDDVEMMFAHEYGDLIGGSVEDVITDLSGEDNDEE